MINMRPVSDAVDPSVNTLITTTMDCEYSLYILHSLATGIWMAWDVRHLNRLLWFNDLFLCVSWFYTELAFKHTISWMLAAHQITLGFLYAEGHSDQRVLILLCVQPSPNTVLVADSICVLTMQTEIGIPRDRNKHSAIATFSLCGRSWNNITINPELTSCRGWEKARQIEQYTSSNMHSLL